LNWLLSHLLCRFLHAGNDERASEERRTQAAGVQKSAKARGRGKFGRRQSSERYENSVSASLSVISATPRRADGHACRVTNESVAGMSAGTRSASTGGWWVDGRHRFARRHPASQNAYATSAFRHECCPGGDLMFPACLISNSCAWQKWHTRQLARDYSVDRCSVT
jgi:hypothetical protein